MTIVCNQCELQMRVKTSGQPTEAMMHGMPLHITLGDVFECPECGFTVTSSLGNPAIQHFEPDYEHSAEAYRTGRHGLIRYWEQKYDRDLTRRGLQG